MTSDEDHISNATNDCERRILSALVFALDEFRKRVEALADDYRRMRLELEAAERARKELTK